MKNFLGRICAEVLRLKDYKIIRSKVFRLMILPLLILSLAMTGCGGQGDDTKSSAKDTPIKIGIIKRLNVTEITLDTYLKQAAARASKAAYLAPQQIFFDNMSSMIAALQAGQIDELSTYRCVAKYLLAQNSDMEDLGDRVPKISDSFCCALREEDSALKNEFDSALKKITADGTLAELTEKFINEVDYTEPLPVVELPHFENAPTIKIAVTGDLPPLDYARADGTPAGFNTAVLAEISKIIERNFELIQIDSGARAAALASNQVDVVFWAVMPGDNTFFPVNIDRPDGVILTEPYFSDEVAHVKLKK